MVQGKINRGRHTDHPTGRHSIWTKQCPPPPFPHFLQAGCPSCRSTNSVKALKATSAFGLGRRRLEFSSTVLPAPSPYLLCTYQYPNNIYVEYLILLKKSHNGKILRSHINVKVSITGWYPNHLSQNLLQFSRSNLQ